MISIYSQDNTEYTKNGDAVLIPTRCDLSLTINGAWQLTLEHPYDQEERYKYIVEGAVVQCDIKCIRELPVVKQRFRIYTYTKGLHGITAIGFPIAMESTYDAPIDNLVISGKTGAQAMALIQAFTNKYTLSTDVTKTASASMSNTNVNSAIASGNSNSFIGAWGGEILYSNYDYMVKSRLGDNVAGDHRIIYGRNLTNIEYKKDDSGLTTRIYPISEDGIRLNGTGYVDSPKISDYPIIHHRFMQAPYNLIDTDASSASATAQQTRTSLAAISTAASTLSQGVDISSYPPEYIKQQRADIVAAVQTMALNGVISTSLYNATAKTISDAMAWMNNLAQPEWDWMGSYEAGWKYGNSDGYAVSQYVKIGKTWRYFGANGNWQEPADSSNEWDWYQNTEETGKKYGDFSRYYAHNEYVFITLSGQLKQYWFNEEGWYEEDESGDSNYAWNGSGTAEDPWWFGESSTKYLKSCWAFIDGKYYFFDEYGYYDGSTKFDDYQWDWVDDGSRAWFGNPDHEYAAYYLVNQWCKIDGSWYYFDANGYVYDDNAARANVISLYTTGMASLATTVSTQATALYTLLYSLMTSYAQSKFNSGVDMPYITITVNMADLSKTTEYAGYENLETVKLGDSVECIDNEHDISMTNRVIGLTYDCVRDYNAEVVIGSPSKTVSDVLGNAGGTPVAGGFDTSAMEAQIEALQDKVGDVILNGASVVSNGTADFGIQEGSNISISRSGNVLTINGEGGGNIVYAGTSIPSASIGEEDDLYLQLGVKTEDILAADRFEGLSSGSHITSLSDFVRQARDKFSFVISGNPDSHGNGETGTFTLDGLVVGNTYHIEYDVQYNSGATFPYSYSEGIDICGAYIAHPHNTNLNHISGDFTYTSNGTAIFKFFAIRDNTNFTCTITNLTITGNFYDGIEEIYGKISGKWEKYEGGESYEAGDNVSIVNNVISATDTDEISELQDVELTDLADGEILKYDATAEKWINAEESGQSAYIVNAVKYSTDEQVIGTWIDGKPLYSKIIIGNSTDSTGNSDTQLSLASLNIDTMLPIEGTYNRVEGTLVLTYQFEATETPVTNNYWGFVKYNDNNGNGRLEYRIKLNHGSTNKQIFYIRYTKTTDTAGSGGYQAWGFSPIIYSTEEREVGVWTDNKPLYQKTVISTTTPSQNNWTTIQLDLPTDAVVSKYEAYYRRSPNRTDFIPQYNPTSSNEWLFGTLSNNNFVYKVGSPYVANFLETYITVWYTKTTDVAGSGEYNTLGIPNVHYDGNEKVIGTWFGETLYEQVYTISSLPNNTTTSYNPNISNFKEWVCADCKGEIIFQSGNKSVLPYLHSTDTTAYVTLQYNTDGTIQITTKSNMTTAKAKIILHYTKTS